MSLADFLTPEELANLKDFEPSAAYYSAMDWLVVLLEDKGYVAEPLIPGVVDVLWHPQEKRIIGLKIWDVSAQRAGQKVIESFELCPLAT